MPFFIALSDQVTVDAGQPLLFDLGTQMPLDIAMAARSQIQVERLRRALAHTAGQIIARNDQVLAALIDTARQDMAEGMAGVEMIDGDPVELRSQILFHPCHHPPSEGRQIAMFAAIFWRDDQTEPVPVLRPAIDERLAIRLVGIRTVQRADFKVMK